MSEKVLKLTKEQEVQEKEYEFPYHYLIEEHFHGIFYLELLKLVKNLIKPLKDKTVFDVGCGDGRFCYEIKDESYQVYGIDYSKKAISWASLFNPQTKFLTKDLIKLNLNKKFDRIVCIETLEHIEKEKVHSILNNLEKYLKDDGTLIITVPSKNLPLSEKHVQHFNETSLREVVEKHFRIIRLIGYHKKNIFLEKIIFPLFCNRFYLIRSKIVSKLIKSYYNKFLRTCHPKRALNLVVVCKKL